LNTFYFFVQIQLLIQKERDEVIFYIFFVALG